MIPVIGVMIGAYIVTRMMHLLMDEKPHGLVCVCAGATILAALLASCYFLLAALGIFKLPIIQ